MENLGDYGLDYIFTHTYGGNFIDAGLTIYDPNDKTGWSFGSDEMRDFVRRNPTQYSSENLEGLWEQRFMRIDDEKLAAFGIEPSKNGLPPVVESYCS